jgi:hypothetical protein
MIRFLKELYLAEFAFIFKAWSSSRWSSSWKPSPSLKAGVGVAGVSIFLCLIVIVAGGWIEILIGKQFLPHNISRWGIGIATLAIFLINYYVLVIRGHGIRFEREFDNFKKSKQKLLRISCWVFELSSLMLIFYSFFAYQRFFHIVPQN